MEQINYRGIYQVYVKEAPKTKKLYEIRDFFINKVQQHSFATYIGMFDHYAHTRDIDGEIADNIIGAINIMFDLVNSSMSPKQRISVSSAAANLKLTIPKP